MNMDVLYIVGNRLSQWNNNELRYSLRSIAKNAKGLGRVFIAGYVPEFVDQEAVTCVRVKDQSNVKHVNILRAIDTAIKQTDIGKDDDGWFLYSSDDHFYIRETDFAHYPIYWRGEELPKEVKKGDGAASYHTTLVSTRKLLEWCGLPTKHMAWHGNTYFNAALWKEERFQFLLRNAYEMPEGGEPTCMMLNYAWQNGGYVGEFNGVGEQYIYKRRREVIIRPDYKYAGGNVFQVPDREVISAHDNIGTSALAVFLRDMFPKKCRFER